MDDLGGTTILGQRQTIVSTIICLITHEMLEETGNTLRSS